MWCLRRSPAAFCKSCHAGRLPAAFAGHRLHSVNHVMHAGYRYAVITRYSSGSSSSSIGGRPAVGSMLHYGESQGALEKSTAWSEGRARKVCDKCEKFGSTPWCEACGKEVCLGSCGSAGDRQTICEECAITKREDSRGDVYMITNSEGEEVRGEGRCLMCERVAEYTDCLQCMRKEKMRIRNGEPKFPNSERSASSATGRMGMLGHIYI